MRTSKITQAVSLILMSASLSVSATEKVSPSDLTQVNSFISGSANNNKDISVMGGIAGSYAKGNNFIGLIEHQTETNKGRKAQDTRIRYFQVFDLNTAFADQIGFSVDYKKSWKMSSQDPDAFGTDTVAVGIINKYSLTEKLSVYPNVAYVAGQATGNDGKKVKLCGFQTNIFTSYEINNSSYIIVQPQFQRADLTPSTTKGAAAKVDTFKIKTGYGMSLDQAGQWWIEASHTYTRNNARIKFISNKTIGIDKDHLFEVTASYYF
ncbi:hypothetical protein AB4298_00360 [Shewanella sp. 10N.261.52.F9]|uniref:hypothetical protein n=1 Tax=Shewanella sp. 10N.261.52.F9 TaxID=3229684 RepID=UPI003554626A